jgi:hypothetical protein
VAIVNATLGRRNCPGQCCNGRWRRSLDFSVERWADRTKTSPARLSYFCKACTRANQRNRHRTQVAERRRLEQTKRESSDFYRVFQTGLNMTRAQRHTYVMEGCLPIIQDNGISLADEDYDTTPVPNVIVDGRIDPATAACTGCWRNGSEPCLTCPSRPTEAQLRQVRSEVVAFNRWR